MHCRHPYLGYVPVGMLSSLVDSSLFITHSATCLDIVRTGTHGCVQS